MAQIINISNNTGEGNTFNITQQTSSASHIANPPPSFGFPPPCETIVGRDADEEVLFNLFKGQRKVLITGIGGIGKTTLASLCSDRWVSNKEFKYAVFINAGTDNSAKNSFQAVTKKIFPTIDKTSTEIYEHYNELDSKTIFVLDNIETNYNIYKYLPDKKLTNIFVLGTSQYTELKRIFKLYELEKLSIVSSVDMIHKVLSNNQIKISTHNIQKTNELITDLTEKLDYHPLALEHAAAYIVDCILYNGMSVLTSVELYIKTLSERLEEEPPYEHPTTYRTPVHTALEMNIAKATSKSEDVRKLLFCVSCLDPTYIHIAMFYDHPDFNSERIKAPIRELKKYSIISLDGEVISLHRLIPTVYRSLIKKENTENEYMLVLLNVLFYHNRFLPYHFSYLIQNLNIDKETTSILYIKAFHNNDKIRKSLTARLTLINCNMDDIQDWSALHCSVFAGHAIWFKYFDTNEHGSDNDRLERFASDTWTVFHVQIIRNSKTYLFDFYEHTGINLISFLEHNENQRNKTIIKGLTTLNLCAAFNVNLGWCSKLIDFGSDVNIPDDSGMTPILYAAKNMAYDLVFTLHRAGATYDQSYKELLSAASDGDHESVLALLRASDIDCAVSDFSKTLLHWAVYEGYCDLAIELIGRHTDIDSADSAGNTLLLAAMRGCHGEVITKLLSREDNIEVVDEYGNTPLLVAARKGHSEVVAELLRRGAKIDVINEDGDTPLFVAASRAHSEAVAELLRRGAKVDVVNKLGYTPLLEAAGMGYSEIVAELLRFGAKIELCTNEGFTPLLVAARWGRSEVVAELLRRGANIDAINNRGETALSMAERRRDSTTVKVLNEHRARTGDELS